MAVAAPLARAFRSTLILVQAVNCGAETMDCSQIRQVIRAAEVYLGNVAWWLEKRGVASEIAVETGPPARGILDVAERSRADLVVMTTHGRSGLGRWAYGSVAEAVLARSPVPVLLVRCHAIEHTLRWDVAPTRVLVPLDGSALAEESLPHALALNQIGNGTIILVRALTTGLPTERRQAEAYLTALAGSLRARGVAVETVVRAGPAGDAILDETRVASADLVAIATRGLTGCGHSTQGEVAADVLLRSETLVLLVPPVGARAIDRVDRPATAPPR